MKAWKFFIKYNHEILRSLIFLMMIGILILGVVDFNHNQTNAANTLKSIKSLTEQVKSLETENQNLLQQLKAGNNSIHQQINCVLNFYSQNPSTRNNSTISQPNPCIIKTVDFDGAPVGSAGGTKSA